METEPPLILTGAWQFGYSSGMLLDGMITLSTISNNQYRVLAHETSTLLQQNQSLNFLF